MDFSRKQYVMIYTTDLPKFDNLFTNFRPFVAPISRICTFSRLFAGLNRAAKSMLQKFKILPMEYFAVNKITETAAKIVKFPSKLRNLTGNGFLPYYFYRKSINWPQFTMLFVRLKMLVGHFVLSGQSKLFDNLFQIVFCQKIF